MTAALFVFVIGALLLALAVDLLAETMAMKSSCGKIRASQRGDGRRERWHDGKRARQRGR